MFGWESFVQFCISVMNDLPVIASIEIGILTATYFPSFRFALKTRANPPFPMNSDSV